MRKSIFEFAEICVEACYQDPYLEQLCKDYIVDKTVPELKLKVDETDVQMEIHNSPQGEVYSYGYMESLTFYRKFCEAVLDYGIFLFHASAVEVDGSAYLFTAPSGTGKSTHAALWKQVFGERVISINDDKPLIRFDKDCVYVYGTPWDGKHKRSTNRRAKIQGICILSQGSKNQIKKMGIREAYPMILNQTYRPGEAEGLQKTLELVDRLVNAVPLYEMQCDISDEAARMSYDAMHHIG